MRLSLTMMTIAICGLDHIGVGAGPAGPVWSDHFFGDLMKFIIDICACAVTDGMPYARALLQPDHFKSPSYTPGSCSKILQTFPLLHSFRMVEGKWRLGRPRNKATLFNCLVFVLCMSSVYFCCSVVSFGSVQKTNDEGKARKMTCNNNVSCIIFLCIML